MSSYSSCFLEFDLEHKSLFSLTLLSSDNFSLNIFVQKLLSILVSLEHLFWLIVVVGSSQALVSTCTFYLEMVAQIFGHFETAFYRTNLNASFSWGIFLPSFSTVNDPLNFWCLFFAICVLFPNGEGTFSEIPACK